MAEQHCASLRECNHTVWNMARLEYLGALGRRDWQFCALSRQTYHPVTLQVLVLGLHVFSAVRGL